MDGSFCNLVFEKPSTAITPNPYTGRTSRSFSLVHFTLRLYVTLEACLMNVLSVQAFWTVKDDHVQQGKITVSFSTSRLSGEANCSPSDAFKIVFSLLFGGEANCSPSEAFKIVFFLYYFRVRLIAHHPLFPFSTRRPCVHFLARSCGCILLFSKNVVVNTGFFHF